MSEQRYSKRSNFLLLIALGAPALAWFVQLTANYTIAAYACAQDKVWILHTVSLVSLALAAAGMWCAWKSWSVRTSREEDTSGEGKFLAAGALLLAGLFFLSILAGELSNWLLDPCL